MSGFGVREALRLSSDAHAGQVDKQGRDYWIYHVSVVAAMLAKHGEHAQVAGLLHDVVEDTEWTLDALRQEGVPEVVLSAVDSVTRREGETYADLVGRACADPLGCRVKLADNTANLRANPGLARVDLDAAQRMLDRYLTARDRLVVAVHEHERGVQG